MTQQGFKYIWAQTFGDVPNEEMIEIIHKYVSASPECERVTFWLLMTSSAHTFATEEDRVTWICKRTTDYHRENPLIGMANPYA